MESKTCVWSFENEMKRLGLGSNSPKRIVDYREGEFEIIYDSVDPAVFELVRRNRGRERGVSTTHIPSTTVST